MRAHVVATLLKKAISAGVHMPGEQLSEIKIAEHYGCSRNTLREAFVELGHERLVEKIPNRGVFIATPDAAFVEDLYLARAAIEPSAARFGTFDKSLLKTAMSARDHAAAGNHQEVSSINQKFHKMIVASMGSATLDATMSSLLARMRLTFLFALPNYPTLHSDRVEENIHIAQLVLDDEREEASYVLYEYLTSTLENVLESLEHPLGDSTL